MSSSGDSGGRFTLVGLKQLHQELVINKAVGEKNCAVVVEALRVIAEMVVYGDNKSELLFDFFCEKNMLALFLEIMWVEGGCPAKVHIQILQTLSILVNCVRNDTSLYYLLSNNYINEIIIYPHDFGTDDSLCDQYVSFMKSLSLRLDKQTIQFFFQEDSGSFPLLNKAIDLLDFPEPMVRIAAQSTILNIYSVHEPRARQYALQDEVMHSFFTQIVKLMESKYLTILSLCRDHVKAIKAAELEERNSRGSLADLSHLSNDVSPAQKEAKRLEFTLQSHLTTMEDWLFYLQDVFGLQIMRLRRALVHHLVTEWVYPTLLASLLRRWSGSRLYGSRIAVAAELKSLDTSQLQKLADEFHGSHDPEDEEDEEDTLGAEGGAGGAGDASGVPMEMSPRRGRRKFSPTLAALDEQRRQEEAEEEGDEDEDAMSLVASLLFLTQVSSYLKYILLSPLPVLTVHTYIPHPFVLAPFHFCRCSAPSQTECCIGPS